MRRLRLPLFPYDAYLRVIRSNSMVCKSVRVRAVNVNETKSQSLPGIHLKKCALIRGCRIVFFVSLKSQPCTACVSRTWNLLGTPKRHCSTSHLPVQARQDQGDLNLARRFDSTTTNSILGCTHFWRLQIGKSVLQGFNKESLASKIASAGSTLFDKYSIPYRL